MGFKSEPLQEFSSSYRREWDDFYDDALSNDLTILFLNYLEETIRSYGIVILTIKGFMRSSKSMVAQSIAHMIRFFQKKYLDPSLPKLSALTTIAKNQSHAIEMISKGVQNRVVISDETKTLVGQGSKTEERTIQNVLEICAKNKNHLIFIKPSAFVHVESCKYGLEYNSRDLKKKESIFILYDLGNIGGDGKQLPIGYVRIKKLVEKGYVMPEKYKVDLEKRYTSFFEEEYEEIIKKQIVEEQSNLDNRSERHKRLDDLYQQLKKDDLFKKTDSWKPSERNRYRLVQLKSKYGGRFLEVELKDLINRYEGDKKIGLL